MSQIEIPLGERGVVRVFALSMEPGEAKALRQNEGTDADGRSPIEAALGTSDLNTDFVEVFPLSDVQEIGLDTYLEEGGGIDPDQLDGDRRKLKALEGWVMVVYSGAFGGRGATLHTASNLTRIGTYSESGVDWTEKTRLKSAGAERTSAPAKQKEPSDAAMSGRIAMIALLVIFALTVVVVWIAA